MLTPVVRRRHVAVVPQAFPTGPRDPAGVFTQDYIAAIVPHCDVTVVLTGEAGGSGVTRETRDGVDYVTCAPRAGGRLGRLEGLYRIGSAARHLQGVDLVHAHGPVFNGLPAARVARALNVPLVLSVHTNPFSKLMERPLTRLLTRRVLERADCVCPVSEFLRTQIDASGIRPRRTVVTYNPVDTELFRPAGADGRPHRHIVFAGRLEPYKGGRRVVEAFASIAERWPGWRLTIAGDGPERSELERLLRHDPGLAPRVQLVGGYSRPELARLLVTADCFVYPSERETFGIVLAEAMATGLPVVAPDRTAPPEFIDERSGLLVPPDDVGAIAQAMDTLLSTLPRYECDVIRETVVERFSRASFGLRMAALYSEICEGRVAA